MLMKICLLCRPQIHRVPLAMERSKGPFSHADVSLTTAELQRLGLTRVLVCITFYWRVDYLQAFHLVLYAVSEWQTDVEVAMITQDANALKLWVADGCGLPCQRFRQVSIIDARKCEDPEQYARFYPERSKEETSCAKGDMYMPFLHRQYFADRHKGASGNGTTYLYMEDDLLLPWDALVSWARDSGRVMGISNGNGRSIG